MGYASIFILKSLRTQTRGVSDENGIFKVKKIPGEGFAENFGVIMKPTATT
jgi:hypothetical protein